MVFSSTVFLFLFLPGLLVLYYFPWIKSRGWRNNILLLASMAFYAWGEPLFVFLMLFSVAVNWLFGLLMERLESRKKLYMLCAIVFDVALLVVFKYLSFITENIALLSGNDGIIVDIALPIGISFFTFQMMSYIFDIYYGSARAQRNPLHVALYIMMFPQLIAGPIVRYQQVEAEILERRESLAEFCGAEPFAGAGVQRFIYGLGKKVLLSNYLAQIADNVFDYVAEPSIALAWLGAICYTLQIYFDFSGYSDMARGLGEMFGFHFPVNFNYPYVAKSVTDFWRRWHISLSTWFRDYVYIPMGGNRVKKSRWVLNLFTVWLLTGIWHGANWTFVLWGLIYFAVLAAEKLTGFTEKLGKASHVYTLLVVILAWVFFRAADINAAVKYIGAMFGIGGNVFWDETVAEYLRNTWMILPPAFIGALPVIPKLKGWLIRHGCGYVEYIWLFIVFALSVLMVFSSTYNPFIYFNF